MTCFVSIGSILLSSILSVVVPASTSQTTTIFNCIFATSSRTSTHVLYRIGRIFHPASFGGFRTSDQTWVVLKMAVGIASQVSAREEFCPQSSNLPIFIQPICVARQLQTTHRVGSQWNGSLAHSSLSGTS